MRINNGDQVDTKRMLGQYNTITNPFKHELFAKWMTFIPADSELLEPFAGNNNIPKLMFEAGYNFDWLCYDIDNNRPNLFPQYSIEERDTIDDFPCNNRVCITNPPYLSKVSASRRKIEYSYYDYNDLYMTCLEKMLLCCDYIAAIIPETFLTSGLFRERLYGIISLNEKMFNDTECPVCLALFVMKPCNDFYIYNGNKLLGTFNELSKFCLDNYNNGLIDWKFNDKLGNIGVNCVDNHHKNDIYFHYGEIINPERIKRSSRAYTRISGLPKHIDRDKFILYCNTILDNYRFNTKDIFLTAFKGLRSDGKYRRRISFNILKQIMNKAFCLLTNKTLTHEPI